MKKTALLLMAFLVMPTLQAENYNYLTFEMTDGTRISVSVKNLTLNISGTSLTAGSQTFVLANLAKMYFSDADQGTGIEDISNRTPNEVTEIYDLQGHRVPKAQMQKGIYIVKTNEGTYKLKTK